jgi:hypothetical protein
MAGTLGKSKIEYGFMMSEVCVEVKDSKGSLLVSVRDIEAQTYVFCGALRVSSLIKVLISLTIPFPL